MKRILIIEDDLDIAELERDFLEIAGFDVTIATDGSKGCDLALAEPFDLILLDLMLPGMNGYDICRRIRPEVDVPIIMVTAKGEEMNKVRGLGLGADDYLAKPFATGELVARIKANLAQYERLKSGGKKAAEKRGTELVIGPIVMNTETHRVFVRGTEIELKNKEYELLKFLMKNPDIVFSKEHLYDRLWGMDAFGDLKTVAVHVNRLREKMEDDPQKPRYIQTVWGAGYRLVLV